jgi:tRNA threonylcarbamoyladenosine biosynthesis protein TsaE
MSEFVASSLSITLELPSISHSECFAHHLANSVTVPMVITLSGEIGTGKTTLVRAVLRALGIQGAIKSPTYSLLESYELSANNNRFPTPTYCHHFDLYRLVDDSELEFIGFRDHFQANALCCIEWPERGNLPPSAIDCALTLMRSGEGRCLSIQANPRVAPILWKGIENFKHESRVC